MYTGSEIKLSPFVFYPKTKPNGTQNDLFIFILPVLPNHFSIFCRTFLMLSILGN